MFSTNQLDVIRGYAASMSAQGYKYYLAHQQITNSNSQPDIIMYFSKSEIFATSLYRYTIPAHSMKYEIVSGNYYSSSSSNVARVEASEVDTVEVGLTVPQYLHVSTNATFTESQTIQPNYALSEVQTYETNSGILFIGCVFIFLYSFLKLFRR